MNRLTLVKSVVCALGLIGAASAQVTTTKTTLSASMTINARQACLTSSTGVAAPSFGSTALTGIFVDREFMIVNAATSNSNCWVVTRGFGGTGAYAHASGAVTYVGPTGGTASSPFRNVAPYGGPGSPCTSTAEPYLPQIVTTGVAGNDFVGSVWSCPSSGVASGQWVMVQLPSAAGAAASGSKCFYTSDGGANNAITATVSGLAQVTGSCVIVKLGHTLQAGANTFALNGATAASILSHFNVSNNIGTAYAATGIIMLVFDGTEWLDMSE